MVTPYRFIAFEGVEGSGKSTQVRLLAGALAAAGEDVLVTFEPGATPAGQALRDVLLHHRVEMTPLAELLLFCADRAQHVAEVVMPALAEGKVVLTDRYELSTWAYQGYAGRVGAETAERLNDVATGGLHADLTMILDIDPEAGLRRNRRESEADRIEGKDLAFHRRVREGYLAWAEAQAEDCAVFDAALAPEELHRRILARVLVAEAPGNEPVDRAQARKHHG